MILDGSLPVIAIPARPVSGPEAELLVPGPQDTHTGGVLSRRLATAGRWVCWRAAAGWVGGGWTGGRALAPYWPACAVRHRIP